MLDYIDRDIIGQSPLSDRVKQAYLRQAEAISSRLDGELESNDLLVYSEWRALSLHFYARCGVEGEFWLVFPPGWEYEDMPVHPDILNMEEDEDVESGRTDAADIGSSDMDFNEPEPISREEVQHRSRGADEDELDRAVYAGYRPEDIEVQEVREDMEELELFEGQQHRL